MADNYNDVVYQMEAFGITFRAKDLPLRTDTAKRVTCGQGGKHWYRLSEFRPDAGGVFITGRFGSYKDGTSCKVEVDWTPLKEAERARFLAEREAKQKAAAEQRARIEAEAALGAAELWARGARTGRSPYLERKLVEGEACRYMPDGSILIPLIRYDLWRDQALKGVQRVYPGPRKHWRTGEDLPQKTFTRDCAKAGCATRLGEVDAHDWSQVILVCEGYATGLSIRMATERQWPLFVAMDAGNLSLVIEILRKLYPKHPLLICADDDWKTTQPPNPGRNTAKRICKMVDACHMVYPVFPATLARSRKHTDFNDLHAVAGLDTVARQVLPVIEMVRRLHGC